MKNGHIFNFSAFYKDFGINDRLTRSDLLYTKSNFSYNKVKEKRLNLNHSHETFNLSEELNPMTNVSGSTFDSIMLDSNLSIGPPTDFTRSDSRTPTSLILFMVYKIIKYKNSSRRSGGVHWFIPSPNPSFLSPTPLHSPSKPVPHSVLNSQFLNHHVK